MDLLTLLVNKLYAIDGSVDNNGSWIIYVIYTINVSIGSLCYIWWVDYFIVLVPGVGF